MTWAILQSHVALTWNHAYTRRTFILKEYIPGKSTTKKTYFGRAARVNENGRLFLQPITKPLSLISLVINIYIGTKTINAAFHIFWLIVFLDYADPP